MKIGLVQINPVWENPIESIKKTDFLLSSGIESCKVLIFPEMSLTGFTMHSENFAEEIDGISTTYFIELAKKYKVHVFAGIIEKDEEKIYNSLVHFDNSGIITARYRKIHPFSYAKEDKNYSAGSSVVTTKIENIKIGLSICYDLRFPELYRHYGKERVEIMIDIANWPVPRIDHWKTLLKARAIENQCFMIGVNRTGTDPFSTYNGCSGIYGPMGNEILSIENNEGLFTAEINSEETNEVRNKLPFLNDMKMI